jgi:hypothetical protein
MLQTPSMFKPEAKSEAGITRTMLPATEEQALYFLNSAGLRHGLVDRWRCYDAYFFMSADEASEQPQREALAKDIEATLGMKMERYSKYGSKARIFYKQPFLFALGKNLAETATVPTVPESTGPAPTGSTSTGPAS